MPELYRPKVERDLSLISNEGLYIPEDRNYQLDTKLLSTGINDINKITPLKLESYIEPTINDYNKEVSTRLFSTELQANGKYSLDDFKRAQEQENVEFRSAYLGRAVTQIALQYLYKQTNDLPNGFKSFSTKIARTGNAWQQTWFDNDFSATKPEELPEMALPVLEFVERTKPHIVIGCDRGGRLFGLAMHAAWRQTRDSSPFPTLDGKLHFARVSKSEDPDVLQKKIDEIVAMSIQFGRQRGNELATDEQLRVLFVDDWVINGGTMRLAKQLMKKHGAQTFFAVMCGQGADVTGKDELKTRVSWHDNPDEIGINYLSTLRQNTDGTVTQELKAHVVRGEGALRNRQKIQDAAANLSRIQALEDVA